MKKPNAHLGYCIPCRKRRRFTSWPGGSRCTVCTPEMPAEERMHLSLYTVDEVRNAKVGG